MRKGFQVKKCINSGNMLMQQMTRIDAMQSTGYNRPPQETNHNGSYGHVTNDVT